MLHLKVNENSTIFVVKRPVEENSLENPRSRPRYKNLEGTNQSIKTPALHMRDEQNLARSNNNTTEKLNQLHTSIINNPIIKVVKNKEKKLRNEERRDNNLMTNKNDNGINDTNNSFNVSSNKENKDPSNSEEKTKWKDILNSWKIKRTIVLRKILIILSVTLPWGSY